MPACAAARRPRCLPPTPHPPAGAPTLAALARRATAPMVPPRRTAPSARCLVSGTSQDMGGVGRGAAGGTAVVAGWVAGTSAHRIPGESCTQPPCTASAPLLQSASPTNDPTSTQGLRMLRWSWCGTCRLWTAPDTTSSWPPCSTAPQVRSSRQATAAAAARAAARAAGSRSCEGSQQQEQQRQGQPAAAASGSSGGGCLQPVRDGTCGACSCRGGSSGSWRSCRPGCRACSPVRPGITHPTCHPCLAAVMDGAMLLIAANEPCPQPQTSEHLAAVEIMRLQHIIILQNKVDLVTEAAALNQHETIARFIQARAAARGAVFGSPQLEHCRGFGAAGRPPGASHGLVLFPPPNPPTQPTHPHPTPPHPTTTCVLTLTPALVRAAPLRPSSSSSLALHAKPFSPVCTPPPAPWHRHRRARSRRAPRWCPSPRSSSTMWTRCASTL